MRNVYLKEVRQDFKDNSRIFLGKNRVMAKALGCTPEEEYRENLHCVAEVRCVKNFVGFCCKL